MPQRTALSLALGLTAFVLVLLGGIAMYLNQAPRLAAAQASAIQETGATKQAAGALVQKVIAERDASHQVSIQEANEQLRLANQRLEQAYAEQRALADRVAQAYEQQRQMSAQLEAAYSEQQAVADQLAQVNQQAQARQAEADRLRAQAAAQAAQAAQAAAAAAPPPAPAAPRYKVSSEQAGQIALAAAPGRTLTGQPEVVIFRDVAAYEVTLDRGVVYVDANSGAVLYNGAAVTQTVSATQPPAPAPAAVSSSKSGKSDDHKGEHHDDHDEKDDD